VHRWRPLVLSSSITPNDLFSMNPASSHADDPAPNTSEDTDTNTAAAPPTYDSLLSLKRRKHVELLEDLLRSLDSLIYVQLACLYYLDNTIGLLILRSIAQVFFLTARPAGIPEPPVRSALGAIVGANILCIILHLVNPNPEAGEATGFYLHGSILIDFVGQLGPTSKWRLLGMDLLVLALQIVMLGLVIEKRRIANAGKQTTGSVQTLDAEEAGILRSEDTRHEQHESEEGIEMQQLLAEAPPDDHGGQEGSNTHALDEFYTGNRILAEVDIVETIKRELTAAPDGTEVTTLASGSPGSLLPGLFGGLRLRIPNG
jgi:Fungal domain of unknown function (DUF1746)